MRLWEIPWGLWRRPACETPSKALDILSATARVAPHLLKAQAIPSDTTVRRSAVWMRKPKTILKIRKKATFF